MTAPREPQDSSRVWLLDRSHAACLRRVSKGRAWARVRVASHAASSVVCFGWTTIERTKSNCSMVTRAQATSQTNFQPNFQQRRQARPRAARSVRGEALILEEAVLLVA